MKSRATGIGPWARALTSAAVTTRLREPTKFGHRVMNHE